MNKPKLVILSDLWGFKKSVWINEYIQQLHTTFEIQLYDCCTLGNIDISEYKESILHNQFINGGIKVAAKQLSELEKDNIDILAFSVGGTIAWEASLKINNLYTISSTRLRYQNNKPAGNLNLYFGSNDTYKPTAEWFHKMAIIPLILSNKGHDLYTQTECINQICNHIKAPYK